MHVNRRGRISKLPELQLWESIDAAVEWGESLLFNIPCGVTQGQQWNWTATDFKDSRSFVGTSKRIMPAGGERYVVDLRVDWKRFWRLRNCEVGWDTLGFGDRGTNYEEIIRRGVSASGRVSAEGKRFMGIGVRRFSAFYGTNCWGRKL